MTAPDYTAWWDSLDDDARKLVRQEADGGRFSKQTMASAREFGIAFYGTGEEVDVERQNLNGGLVRFINNQS